MNVELYIYGCQTCGINSVYIRKLKAHCSRMGTNLTIKNTKYDSEALTRHISSLSSIGLSTDNYPPVVIKDGSVSLLRDMQW